jgi:hypothetical protein
MRPHLHQYSSTVITILIFRKTTKMWWFLFVPKTLRYFPCFFHVFLIYLLLCCCQLILPWIFFITEELSVFFSLLRLVMVLHHSGIRFEGCSVAQHGCSVVQLVARSLAVMQARVRISSGYPMEVPPTEPTAVKIWRWSSANVYEWMMYVCIYCIEKINLKRVTYSTATKP